MKGSKTPIRHRYRGLLVGSALLLLGGVTLLHVPSPAPPAPGSPPVIRARQPAFNLRPDLPLPAFWTGLAVIGCSALLGAGDRRRRRRQEEQTRRREDQLAQRESQLELAERRYRQLLDHAGDALFFLDPENGSLVDLNRQAEELLGYTAEEIGKLSPAALFPGRQKRRYLRLVRTVRHHGYGESDDLLFRRKDGSLFPGAVHARLGLLGDRELVHCVVRNVSERKRMEAQLRQRNRDLSLLNEISHCTSTASGLRDMAEAVLDLLIPSFTVAGGGFYLARDGGKSLQLEAQRGIPAALQDTIDTLDAGHGIIGRVLAGGQARGSADLQRDRRLFFTAIREAGWRGFLAVPAIIGDRVLGVLFLFDEHRRVFNREELRVLNAVGRQLGTSVESFNLFEALQWQNRLTQASNRELRNSRQKLREHLVQMAEAKESLERLEGMKSQFLSLASHELRTPLTYVLSGTEFLQEQLAGRLDPDHVRALDAVRQGGGRLDVIVRDLLEVARLESRSLYLAREPVDPQALFRELLIEFDSPSRQRNLRLSLGDFPPDVRLLGDPHHLRRTFQRLLENAVKFTPEDGWIEVGAACRDRADLDRLRPTLQPFCPTFFEQPQAGSLLQISVRDSGVGIDPEDHLPIFDTFYEVGDIAAHFTSCSRFGGKGVGLGLALVKRVVEAHGGMVWVESRGTAGPETGSTFHVLLPTAPAEERRAGR